MSEHDELADRREAEANYLEAAAERNEDRAEEARDALKKATRDETVPAALGEDDPAHREPSTAEREAEEEEADQPPPPSSPGEKSQAALDSASGDEDRDDEDDEDDDEDEPPSEDEDDPARPNA